jgi:glycosyltransferase involved in cell wall biosynthesis
MPLTVAYLINQYPKVSHSFIRREILALEAMDIQVLRYAIRSSGEVLVDPDDLAEFDKTRVVLNAGVLKLLVRVINVALTRSLQWIQALRLAWQMGWHSDRGLLVHLVYLAEACLLLEWFQTAEVNHVHAHFGTNPPTVALLCRMLGGPTYSFTVHGPEEFDRPLALHLRQKIEHAAFVVAVSSFGRSQLFRWCSYQHWSRIHIIHCGLDQGFLEAPRVAIADTPNLVCIGRLCEDKGQLLLLDAVAELISARVDLQLTLVGDGPLRPVLEATITRLNLQAQVEITGWVNSAQIRDYLLSARALVLPSFAEGLPVVLMEALALQRPVVTTSIAGIPELVEPGICGWLVPAGSVSALKTALQEVLTTEPAVLDKMGQQGAQLVMKDHNIEIEAQKLARLFGDQTRNQPSIDAI